MEGYIAVAILATIAFIASFFVKIENNKHSNKTHH